MTEKELEQEYSDPEKIKQHPEMEKFIKWVAKKDLEIAHKKASLDKERLAEIYNK